MRRSPRITLLLVFCAAGAGLALWIGRQVTSRGAETEGRNTSTSSALGSREASPSRGFQVNASPVTPALAELPAVEEFEAGRAARFNSPPPDSTSSRATEHQPRVTRQVPVWPAEPNFEAPEETVQPRYDARQGAEDFGNLLAESFVRRVVKMVQEQPPDSPRTLDAVPDHRTTTDIDDPAPSSSLPASNEPRPNVDPPSANATTPNAIRGERLSPGSPLGPRMTPHETPSAEDANQDDEQPNLTDEIRIQPQPEPSAAADEFPGEGDDRLQIFVKGGDIREVFAQLSAEGNLNILPTNSVQGTVSIALADVSAETALDAILRSTGYVARREGNFIFVGSEADFEKQQRAADKVGTRIYRPNYVSAKDLKELITPLLTASIGKISVTPPPQVGIQTNDNDAGGDSTAGREALLIQDYDSVLDRLDQIVRNVDRRPPQVAIEAMILSVQINDDCELGVDFEFLRDHGHITLASGSPMNDLASLSFDNGGLKLAYLDGSMGGFVSALETFGDTNVIATPKLMALNKQRAEILIGAQLGYVSTTVTETAATQSVEFLEVGTQLRLRPFISSDGMVRLEVHPELSTGNVRIEDGVTLPDKEVTKVTTNVMVRDGCTVILGGLMREDLSSTGKQIPYLGSMPVIGPLFRLTNQKTERREILILLTPHIVDDEGACCEGDDAAAEFHRRQQIFADKMSPLGKRYLGRKHFRLAQEAWALGDRERAMRHVNLSIHIDPFNRAAIDLRSDIVHGVRHGNHTLDSPPLGWDEFGAAAPPVMPWEATPSNASDEVKSRPLPPREPAEALPAPPSNPPAAKRFPPPASEAPADAAGAAVRQASASSRAARTAPANPTSVPDLDSRDPSNRSTLRLVR